VQRPGKLKALNITKLATPGMYGDGGGLYLQVTGAGAKSWIFRYWVQERDATTGQPVRDPTTNKVRGTSREMGLGSLNVVSLSEARDLADQYRRLRHQGADPIEARRAVRDQAAFEAARTISFKDAATAYIDAHRAGWRNAKHADQWSTTLEAYAYPAFGEMSVQAIDTVLVMKAIEPIWSTKSEGLTGHPDRRAPSRYRSYGGGVSMISRLRASSIHPK
jgi:Arm DNA-binding domain/Phage integrase central domain